MTMNTRVEPNIYNYDGVNFYNEQGEFIGEAKWKLTKSGKVRVAIDIDGLRAVPKAIDNRDDEIYEYHNEDCIDYDEE